MRARISRFVKAIPAATASFKPGIGGTAALEPAAIISFLPSNVSPFASTVKPLAVLPVILAEAARIPLLGKD